MHSTKLHVRTYECDAYGHVNNAVYLNYLEYSRDCFLKSQGVDYQGLVAAGFGIWVAEATLTYLSPAVPNEELNIITTPSESGAAFVVLGQSIRGPQDRRVLDAVMKLVWVGPSGRPTRIPTEWRAKLFKAT